MSLCLTCGNLRVGVPASAEPWGLRGEVCACDVARMTRAMREVHGLDRLPSEPVELVEVLHHATPGAVGWAPAEFVEGSDSLGTVSRVEWGWWARSWHLLVVRSWDSALLRDGKPAPLLVRVLLRGETDGPWAAASLAAYRLGGTPAFLAFLRGTVGPRTSP